MQGKDSAPWIHDEAAQGSTDLVVHPLDERALLRQLLIQAVEQDITSSFEQKMHRKIDQQYRFGSRDITKTILLQLTLGVSKVLPRETELAAEITQRRIVGLKIDIKGQLARADTELQEIIHGFEDKEELILEIIFLNSIGIDFAAVKALLRNPV